MSFRERIDSRALTRFLLVIEAVAVLGVAAYHLRIVNDDVFITMRYARNLQAGMGLVYNPGEAVFGITCPLLALLQAFFGFFTGGDILIANYLLQFLLLAGCIVLAARYLESPLLTAAVIPALCLNDQTAGYLGNEVLLVLFLALASLVFMRQGREALFALTLGAVYLARFDGFIFGFVATAWWIASTRQRDPRKIAMHVLRWALLPVIWHLFSWFYYGTLFSNSVTSKIFGSENIRTYANILFTRRLPELIQQPNGLAIVALAVIGLLAHWRKCGIFLLWFIGFTCVYAVIQAPGILPWYYHTLAFLKVMSVAAGIAFLSSRLFPDGQWQRLVLCVALGGLVVGPLDFGWEQQRYDLYRTVAEKLKPEIAPNAYVEMNEIGILGYYLERPVLDEHYLVTAQGQDGNLFPPMEQLREQVKPQFIIVNPYRRFTAEDMPRYPNYMPAGEAASADESIRVYFFKRL